MKTIEVDDNSDVLDVLNQGNSFVETIREESDDIKQLQKLHIALLKVNTFLMAPEDYAVKTYTEEAKALVELTKELLEKHESERRSYTLKFYGRREVISAMFVTEKLVK